MMGVSAGGSENFPDLVFFIFLLTSIMTSILKCMHTFWSPPVDWEPAAQTTT